MASTIQIRVDDDLKNKSDQLFKDLGTDTTSAIRIMHSSFYFKWKSIICNRLR